MQSESSAAAAAGHAPSRRCTLGSKIIGLGAVTALLVLGPELLLNGGSGASGARDGVSAGRSRVRFGVGSHYDHDVASNNNNNNNNNNTDDNPHPTGRGPAVSPRGEVLDPVCAGWGCTCQGFSELHMTWAWHWGSAPAQPPTTRTWWVSHDCATTPSRNRSTTPPNVITAIATPSNGIDVSPAQAPPIVVRPFAPPQLPPPPPKQPAGNMRLAVVTEIGARGQDFDAQFAALLFESWNFWRKRKQARAAGGRYPTAAPTPAKRAPKQPLDPIAAVDLFAFCEVGACQLMPPECREVSYGKPVPVAPGPGSCYFSILPPCELPASAQKYKFLFSLFFLADEGPENMLSHYDYVMRTDADAQLGETAWTWYPPDGAAFGSEYMGWPDLTFPWLEDIAAELGLQHHQVHAMQSTYYLPSHLVRGFSGWMVNLTVHFLEHEFTEAKCAEKLASERFKTFLKQHDGDGKKGLTACRWPFWHIGVATLYAQNIVVNHFLATVGIVPTQAMVTNKLDAPGSRFNPHGQAQAHLMQIKHQHPLSDLLGHFRMLLAAMLAHDGPAMHAQCGWFESADNRDRTAGGPLALGSDFDDWTAERPSGGSGFSHFMVRRAFTRQCLRPTFEWYRRLVAAAKVNEYGVSAQRATVLQDTEICDWVADDGGSAGVDSQLLRTLDLDDVNNVAWDSMGFNLTQLRQRLIHCSARL